MSVSYRNYLSSMIYYDEMSLLNQVEEVEEVLQVIEDCYLQLCCLQKETNLRFLNLKDRDCWLLPEILHQIHLTLMNVC